MGRWAECLSQTRNFAKARFSEIWRRAGQCRLPECRQKSWRAPLHRLRWLRHHQHYAFDGPCSGCSGRLDNADDVSEIMQRLPVGSRFNAEWQAARC